jgi:hypothetical protein
MTDSFLAHSLQFKALSHIPECFSATRRSSKSVSSETGSLFDTIVNLNKLCLAGVVKVRHKHNGSNTPEWATRGSPPCARDTSTISETRDGKALRL